jgi:hypothetical protein
LLIFRAFAGPAGPKGDRDLPGRALGALAVIVATVDLVIVMVVGLMALLVRVSLTGMEPAANEHSPSDSALSGSNANANDNGNATRTFLRLACPAGWVSIALTAARLPSVVWEVTAVPLHEPSSVVVLCGPQLLGLLSGAREPSLRCSFSEVNGNYGLSSNVATSLPV